MTGADHIHVARTMLAQVPVFAARGQRDFALILLRWAANSRLRATTVPREMTQVDMFGDAREVAA